MGTIWTIIGMIIIAILIIWRLCSIFRMIFTFDFILGLLINVPLFLLIDSCCRKRGYRPSDTTIIIIICIGYFCWAKKDRLIPREFRKAFTMPISTTWVIVNSVVMAIFIALFSGLVYKVPINHLMEDVLPTCWIFGLFLMIVSNSARVPWVVLTNFCLLGLFLYNVSGDGGHGDGNYDGADANYDANLPDDSIWANFTSDTSVVDATPDFGTTDFMIPDTDMAFGSDFTIAPVSDFTPLDTWGSFDLADTSFTADVPQFADDPYMALGTGATFNDNFQICDASGMPELTIADGSIFNSENIVVGHIEYDPTLHVTTYSDATNMPYMHVDRANNVYTGDDCYMGHFTDSGNIRTVRDAKGSIAYRIDKLTNTIFDGKTSSIIGTIRNS